MSISFIDFKKWRGAFDAPPPPNPGKAKKPSLNGVKLLAAPKGRYFPDAPNVVQRIES